MKKYSFVILVILSVVFAAVSCNGNKQKTTDDSDLVPQAKMVLSAEDTTAVYQLVNAYLESLKAGKIDEAVALIHSFASNDSLTVLTDEQKENLKGSLMFVAQKDYRIDYLKFYKDYDNEVRIKCILFENKPGENAPNEMTILLRPVRYLGIWYLTMADESTHSSEISK